MSYMNFQQFKDEVTNAIQTATLATSDQVTASLAFNDTQRAQQILQGLSRYQDIYKVCLYDSSKVLFADYVSPQLHSACTKTLTPIAQDQSDFQIFSVPIKQGAIANLGEIQVYARLYRLSETLSAQIIFVLLFFILGLCFIAYPFASYMQRTISRPAQNLVVRGKALSRAGENDFMQFDTRDEFQTLQKIIDQLQPFLEESYENMEALESVFKNQLHYINLMKKVNNDRQKLNNALTKGMKHSAYDNIVETAEYSLDMQEVVHEETTSYLELLQVLYDDQIHILRSGKIKINARDLYTTLAGYNYNDFGGFNTVISNIDKDWGVSVYEEAFFKTLEAVIDLIKVLKLKTMDYKMSIEAKVQHNHELVFMVISQNPNYLNFDFDHKKADVCFAKINNYHNLNRCHEDAFNVTVGNDHLKITIRFT